VPLTLGQPFGSRNAGKWEFFIAEQVMLISGMILYVVFRRKGWL
jgi:hypothetical protein